MEKVRWGLLSTAKINRALIPVIRKSPRSVLAAVASRSRDTAREYAQKWHIPLHFGSYQEMLASGEIDAVYISLPNHLHAKWSIKALESGVAVLCEKPFALTLAEVEAMTRASLANQVPLAEALMYRHHPQTKMVGEWVRSGKLGELTLIRGAFDFRMKPGQRHPDSLNVRLVPEYGGGCLWDLGIYPLSYTQFLLDGPPAWVFGQQQIGDTGVDEVFAGTMGYELENGQRPIAQISCSFRTPFHTFLEVIGTDGRLYISRPFTELEQDRNVVFSDKGGKIQKLRMPQQPLYLGEVEDLEAAVLDSKPTRISLEESRNQIRTVLALYESAKSGQVIGLQEP